MRLSKKSSVAGLALAGTLAVGSLTLASPASASVARPAGGQDGLVNIVVNNVVVQPNIPVAVAANLCDINVNAVSAVDQHGGTTECKALSTALTKAFVTQN